MRGSDLLMSNTSSSSSNLVLSNSLPRFGVEHLDVRQREVERGERGQHQARVPGPPGGMSGDAPVRQADQQAHVRPPPPADADIGKIARRTRVRGVAVGPAVQ